MSVNSTHKAISKYIKVKHSTGREFQSLAAQGKKHLTDTLFQHLGMVTGKTCKLSV